MLGVSLSISCKNKIQCVWGGGRKQYPKHMPEKQIRLLYLMVFSEDTVRIKPIDCSLDQHLKKYILFTINKGEESKLLFFISKYMSLHEEK